MDIVAAAAKEEAKDAQQQEGQQPANGETTEAKAAADKSNMRQNLTGKQKAAMLLISIGAEKSAEIMNITTYKELENYIEKISDEKLRKFVLENYENNKEN